VDGFQRLPVAFRVQISAGEGAEISVRSGLQRLGPMEGKTEKDFV